jgi:ribosomal protein L37AE/L43A
MSRRCWNCGHKLEPLRSKRTGIEYCSGCGLAVSGVGWVNAMNKQYGAPHSSSPEEGAKDASESAKPHRKKE